MSLNKIGNSFNLGIQGSPVGENNNFDVEKNFNNKFVMDLFHIQSDAELEKIKQRIVAKLVRDDKKFQTEVEFDEYLLDVYKRLHNMDYIGEVFETDNRGAITELVDYFEIPLNHAEMMEYYAKQRKSSIDDMGAKLAQRKLENPEYDEEEKFIGIYREQIETHVREAVFDLIKKGYETAYSGFDGMESQSIGFKEDCFIGFEFSSELVKRLDERGVKLKIRPDKIYFNLSQKLSMEELRNIWNDIVAEIPEATIVAEMDNVEQVKIGSRTVELDGNAEFSEIIIFDKTGVPTEKMVRIYRGVNHLDSSVFRQIPYAMRSENKSGKPKAIEDVRDEVEILAENPTYENLLAYVEKVRPCLSVEKMQRIDDDLLLIEDGILKGYSARCELVHKNIEHNGGWGDGGITPYISASHNPEEASAYGREGVIVIDIPLSKIEDFGFESDELCIKGALDKKYITAILTKRKNRDYDRGSEIVNQDMQKALQKLSELINVSLYDNDEIQSVREKKFISEKKQDGEQYKKDVESVRFNRVMRLAKEFPEINIDFEEAQKGALENGVDVYTKVKTDIFDYYKNQLESADGYRRNLDDYNFSESLYGQEKKYDRNEISDIMLIELRKITQGIKKRWSERNKR